MVHLPFSALPPSLLADPPPPDYNQITRLVFGDYVQTTLGPTRSDAKSHTVGAIALFPSGNPSGSWYFMSTLTGDILHRYWWKNLPATTYVLDRVKTIALKQNQPEVETNFIFDINQGGSAKHPPFGLHAQNLLCTWKLYVDVVKTRFNVESVVHDSLLLHHSNNLL